MLGFHARRLAFPLTVFGLLLFTLVPTAVSAAYPPGTVVSRYVDVRYCGDGNVSVVADQSGNLIDICTNSGARIDPSSGGIAPYTPPVYNPALPGGPSYTPPVYNTTAPGAAPYGVQPYAPGNGYLPSFNNGYVPPVNGYAPPVPGSNGVTGTVVRQYTDNNSNCPNGDVTQTTGGFYCTANGSPAAATGYTPVYNSGYAPPFSNGYAPAFNNGYAPAPYNGYAPPASGYTGSTGTVIRQYNDGNSNCPNGDVTQTTVGFFCTANGAPAVRTG